MLPFPLPKTKAVHSILKDNPSLCSQLSKFFTRFSQAAFHFKLFQLTDPLLVSLAHILSPIQLLSASPVPTYTLFWNILSASQPAKFAPSHFTSWNLLSSKESSHQSWFWLVPFSSTPAWAQPSRYCWDRRQEVSAIYVAAWALSCGLCTATTYSFLYSPSNYQCFEIKD